MVISYLERATVRETGGTANAIVHIMHQGRILDSPPVAIVALGAQVSYIDRSSHVDMGRTSAPFLKCGLRNL